MRVNVSKNKVYHHAFLGCGSMGRVMSQCLNKAEAKTSQFFHTYTPSGVKAKALAQDLAPNAQFHREISELPLCDFYWLALKPQNWKDLRGSLKEHFQGKSHTPIIISLMAGISAGQIERDLEGEYDKYVMRMMPNTPLKNSQGVILVYNPKASPQIEEKVNQVVELFKDVSLILHLERETQIDELVGPLSCSPAIIFTLGKIFTDSLLKLNPQLSPHLAQSLTGQIFSGSVSLIEKNKSWDELIREVASKGGVTEELLLHLEKNHWGQILEESFEVAKKKSIKMGQIYSTSPVSSETKI
jgi:pyrroline-5-carboxylate reductase